MWGGRSLPWPWPWPATRASFFLAATLIHRACSTFPAPALAHHARLHPSLHLQIPFDEASLGAPFLTPEAEKFLLDDEVGLRRAGPCCMQKSASFSHVSAPYRHYNLSTTAFTPSPAPSQAPDIIPLVTLSPPLPLLNAWTK